MMTVLDPSIAGKAGDLSEHHCTAIRSQSRDIVEVVAEVEELVPGPELKTMMAISP